MKESSLRGKFISELSKSLEPFGYKVALRPHMTSYAAQDEVNKVIYIALNRRGTPVSLEDMVWAGFHDLGHVVDGRSDQEYVEAFLPTLLHEQHCDRFGLHLAIDFLDRHGVSHSLQMADAERARYSTRAHVAEWLSGFNKRGPGFSQLDAKMSNQILSWFGLPERDLTGASRNQMWALILKETAQFKRESGVSDSREKTAQSGWDTRFRADESKLRKSDEKLWEMVADFPVEQVNVDELYKRYRDKKTWGKGLDGGKNRGNRGTVTPGDILRGNAPPFEVYRHKRLINEADTTYPIVIQTDGRVLDGVHRIMKAKQQGLETIPAVWVGPAEKTAKKKRFRASRDLPALGAVAGGLYGLRKGKFDPKWVSKSIKPNSLKGRALAGMLGAGTGAGFAALPTLVGSSAKAHLTKKAEPGPPEVFAYVSGPSGGGKSHYVRENFPKSQFDIVEIDSFAHDEGGPGGYKIDWKGIRKKVKESTKPVVIDGLDIDRGLARQAKHKLLVNPGKEQTIAQRVRREKGRDVLAAELWDMYSEHVEPVAKKLGFRSAPASIPRSFFFELKKLAEAAKLLPPPKNNRKKWPYQATINFYGITINVENKKGTSRSGEDADGKPWKTTMRNHYGEFAGTKGVDGDPVDCYVGPDISAANAYVVHQKHPGTQVSDEDKVMLGFLSREDAIAAYRKHYNKPGFFQGCTAWPVTELISYLKSAKHRGKRLDQPRRVKKLMKKLSWWWTEGEDEEEVIFHGSPHKLKAINPSQAKGMNEFQGQSAVYGTKSPEHAALYAVSKGLKGKTTFAVTPTEILVVGSAPLQDGFVHKLEGDAVRGKGKEDKGQAAILTPKPLTPLSVTKVEAKDYEDKVRRFSSKQELVSALQKLAAHADDRLKERSLASPEQLSALRNRLKGMNLLPEREYYHPFPEGGYAVISPVGRRKKRKHVVKTVLAPHMNPRGYLLPL